MKNKIVLPLALVLIATLHAEAGTRLSETQKAIAKEQHKGSNGGFFDNDRETNTSDAAEEKVISEKTQEDFGGGSIGVRFSEIAYKRKVQGNNLISSTSTFDGDYLRSTTYCEGTVTAGTWTGSREVYCATATQKACENVLAAYRQEANTEGSNLKDQKQKAEACVKTLSGYSKILAAYGPLAAANPGLAADRQEIVEKESAAMKKVLGKLSTDATYTTTSLNQLSSRGELEAVSQKLTGSISGIQQISKFIDLCERNQRNWNPKQANPNRPVLSTPKAKAAGGTN